MRLCVPLRTSWRSFSIVPRSAPWATRFARPRFGVATLSCGLWGWQQRVAALLCARSWYAQHRNPRCRLGAVSALEKLSKREVCPWWSLFAKCRLSDADACTRCPSLQLATQAQVDEISARCDDNTKKRISGVPTDARGAPTANPAPGTGKEPSPKKKAKLDGV